jgi:DNA topoisomerase-2
MHLFTDEEKLTKFNTETEIIERYFPVRLKYYQKRKDYMIAALEKELRLLSNKTRYIQSNLQGEIDLRNMKKIDILNMMSELKYDTMDEDTDYKYLLKMPMDSVSEENVVRLLKDKTGKENELSIIQSTSIEKMWLNELDELKKMLVTVEKVSTEKGITIKVKKTIKKVVKK